MSQTTSPHRGAQASGGERSLTRPEKKLLAILGMPTLGLALSITTVSTYLPKVASQFTGSATVIGVIVGAEGLMALWLPIVVGTWSDSVRTRLGGRLPFMLAGIPVVAAALVLMGYVSSLLALGLAAAAFFIGYFTAYAPYRALYPDLVDEDITGRGQSVQALFRGAGTFLALVGGGLLLAIGRPDPFVAAAVVLVLTSAAFVQVMRVRGVSLPEPSPLHGVGRAIRELGRLLAEQRQLRAFLAANALWELSLAALKTFVVLYITDGLRYTLSDASLIIGATALIVLPAALISGKLADRLGKPRVMLAALVVYGPGLLLPFLTQTRPILIAAVPLVAIGGGVIMTLPYALLIPLMPAGEHGALTGFYSLTRGLGTMLGPLVAGVTIQLLRHPLAATHGYQAMWLVCSAAVLLSIPFAWRLLDSAPEGGEAR